MNHDSLFFGEVSLFLFSELIEESLRGIFLRSQTNQFGLVKYEIISSEKISKMIGLLVGGGCWWLSLGLQDSRKGIHPIVYTVRGTPICPLIKAIDFFLESHGMVR